MPIEDIYLPEGDFENPLLQSQGYDLLKPTTGQALKAGLGLGQLEAPVNYLRDLDTYNTGPGVKLTPEAANKEYGIPGYLNFDRELAPEAARVVRERTLKRLSFDDVLNRASTAQNVGALGANFVGQMFDPINLATAFVPVTKIPGVSTMMTSLLTKNPFTQRAAIGAVEGTVGQALIEPIYIAGDQLGFEEHTNADVMRNLAFGTIFGAGAHVTLGAGADAAKFLYGKALSTHNVAVEKSILQLMDGGVVNVDPIIRTDPAYTQKYASMNELGQLESTGRFSQGTDPVVDYGNLPMTRYGDPTFRNPVDDGLGIPESFSGTKVLGSDGRPTVVYHGTGAKDFAEYTTPAFFTPDKQGAEWYAKNREDVGGNERIEEVYLNIKNPLDATGKSGALTLVEIAEKAGVKTNFMDGPDGWEVFIPEVSKYSPYDGTNYIDALYIPKVREALISEGYDGVFLLDTLSNDSIPTWVALKPDQIKRASKVTKDVDIGKPLTIPELTAAATAYSQAPSSAASIDTFVPPEATMFNPKVQPEIKPGQPVTNTELEQVIADLEFEAKSVLSKEELASINEANNASVKETDSYIGGLNQAFTCWKNG